MDFSSYFEDQMAKSLDKETKENEEYINSLVTRNDYVQAVTEYGFTLSSIPEEIKTKEFFSDLIKDPDMIIDLDEIPEELINYELCMRVVSQEGFALRTVPAVYRDFNLCLVAVTKEPQAIDAVPNDIRGRVNRASLSARLSNFSQQQ